MRSQFQRPISPNERLYLAGEKLAPPFVVQIAIEGEGDLDLDRLRAAVEAASDACPGARLVARGGRWVDSGQAPPVRAIEEAGFDGFHFGRESFATRPLEPRRGPTCEVLLLEGDRPAIVFRAFHGVMDGKGALHWIRSVFRELRGEPSEPASARDTDADLLARLGRSRRAGLTFDVCSPWGSGPVAPCEHFWRRLVLPGAHPGLVAKLAASIQDACDLDRTRFMVPVDLRRHVPMLASTANMSMPLFLDARRGDRWDVLHARLLDGLARHGELATAAADDALAWMPDWGLRAGIRLATVRQQRRGRYMATGILSHLGRIELSDFSTPAFQARTVYSLPVHVPLAPLAVVAVECPDHVELVFSAPAGEGQHERVDQLLAAITRDLAIGEAPKLTWCDPQTTVVQLFRDQVARTPLATALIGDTAMSYEALDRRSEAIGHALRVRGVGPGVVVGLLAERSAETLAALWGVLKAGGAYLPLDPQAPDERLAYILADSRAQFCLAHAERAAKLEAALGAPCLAIEALEAVTATEPLPEADPADLAYVIYTSGSTGRPKGVMIEHRSLVNYVQWARETYGVDRETRFALFTSLAFDLTVTSIFLPLLAGGSVFLFPEETNAVTLQHVLDQEGCNALKLTPAHLELITQLEVPLERFRLVVVGGEPLRASLAARAQALFGPECHIFNEYGPTEATVGCVVHRFDGGQEDVATDVPIGLPGANTRIHLLDDQRRSVRPGARGEIFIEGACLARGYLGREDLDRHAFVRLENGARAYRTGDLARRRSDGALEFLGRNDDQVKVRGYRIELGEIETLLAEHPQVVRAVVVARPRQDGAGKLLAAYYTSCAPLTPDAARAYLATRLPSYMLPASLIPLTEVPLTLNGKVDVAALPLPGVRATECVRVPERSEVEQAVALIWASQLGVEAGALEPEADFHQLGGDSLTMVAMLSAVAERIVGPSAARHFRQEVPPILMHPTLETVCRAVERARAQAVSL